MSVPNPKAPDQPGRDQREAGLVTPTVPGFGGRTEHENDSDDDPGPASIPVR